MKLQSYYIWFILGMLIACADESENADPDNPSNLMVDVQINENKTGEVDINASAENATEFSFSMGDGSDEIINTTGLLNYTYSRAGIFTLEIRAYGSNGKFLRKNIQITVQIGESGGGFENDGYSTPISYDGMTLTWNDEFDGTFVNQGNWNYDIGTGNGGWGNNEWQYYREENATVNNGFLTIEAKRESFNGRDYTSTRLKTVDKVEITYGRVDIRAKLPEGQGIWPALWMLGANFDQVGWPLCGEIDIMELVGHEPSTVHGTIHYGDPWPNNRFSGDSYSLQQGKFSDSFNVFSIVWEENKIQWFVNDQLYLTKTPADLGGHSWLFNHDFFLIFNVAVGGNWPGYPDGTTVFPQKMIVDYVRVFQNQ